MRSLASIPLAVLLVGVTVSVAGERHASAKLEEALCLGCPRGDAVLTETADGGSKLAVHIFDLQPGSDYELRWFSDVHCLGTATTIEGFKGNSAGHAAVNAHLDATLDEVKSIGIAFEGHIQNCGTFEH